MPDAPSVQARPPSRVARFHDQAGHAGVMQSPTRAHAGRAATDDHDLEFTAGHGRLFARSRASWQARVGLVG